MIERGETGLYQKVHDPIQGTGWRWGDKGKEYFGPDAKEKAFEQGAAIERTRQQYREERTLMFPLEL
jgi:hypothetical protein